MESVDKRWCSGPLRRQTPRLFVISINNGDSVTFYQKVATSCNRLFLTILYNYIVARNCFFGKNFFEKGKEIALC